MTSTSASDRNKVILLSIAVVAVFGFLFWRVLGTAGGSSAPSQPVHVDTPPVAANVPAGSTAAATAVDVVQPANADLVNPFRAVLPTGSGSRTSHPMGPPQIGSKRWFGE